MSRTHAPYSVTTPGTTPYQSGIRTLGEAQTAQRAARRSGQSMARIYDADGHVVETHAAGVAAVEVIEEGDDSYAWLDRQASK